MKTFRRILFWTHLAAGLIAGLFIGVMCLTGTIIAFEDEIVAWAERDARTVTVPANLPSDLSDKASATAEALAKEGASRLPLTVLQQKFRTARPDFRATGFTLNNDPAAAIQFSAGREGSWFVNPYTGEARQPASTKMHDFMHVLIDWHRFLGREGDARPAGKLINGICNLAFFGLAVTGLYLWMPRTWSWNGVKAIALFNAKAAGKARDFNWHNVIGLWSAPILIVLTLTAVPISFRWGGNLIYRLVGEQPPAPPGAPGAATPAVEIKRPSADAKPLAHDMVVTALQKDFPRWAVITLRTAPAQRGGQPPAVAPVKAEPSEAAAATGDQAQKKPNPVHPLTVTIRESGSWPRTATTTLTLNPFTGELLKREGFADFTPGRQIRTWTRYLHTGQALGWPGQLIAGLACLGGCFLVYTGFALSWRRFLGKPARTPAS